MNRIKDDKTFYKFLKDNTKNKNHIYRGVSSTEYTLKPSIARLKYKDKKERDLTEEDEDLIFRHFKQRAKPFLSKEFDEMNLLAIAQHHGLPTRLLDWTFNPIAAAYFAVEHSKKDKSDSVIYVWNKPGEAIINKQFNCIKVNKLEFFIPNHNDERIINQNGLFTIHPYPWAELKEKEIKTYFIDNKYRRDLRKLLNRLGINKSIIYPGLDGVAGHIKWMQTNYY